MQRQDAYRYHDAALRYLQGMREERSGALESMAHEDAKTLAEPRIAIAVEDLRKEARVALRVRERDDATLSMIAEMQQQGLVPDDVEIDEVGPLFGYGPRDRVSPLQPGVSCAHELGERGTIGCLLRKDGQLFLFSANHVIARENHAKVGDAIMQPTALATHRRIGSLHAFEPLAATGNLMDAAVAAIEVPDIDPRIFNGKRITSIRTTPLTKGDTVFKFGQATEERRGKCLGIASNVTLDMHFRDYAFDLHIEIEATGKTFSCGGDSGALVYDENDQAIGFVIGGNCVNRTYVTPVAQIVPRFGMLV